MAVAPRTSGGSNNANGNSTTASLTVPASCAIGDVLVVLLGLNNTNVITARPSTAANVTGITQSSKYAELMTIYVEAYGHPDTDLPMWI